MQLIKSEVIQIAAGRQRKEIDAAALLELSNSISSIGLIHAIVVRSDANTITLVAGERRMKAIEALWAMGESFSYGGCLIPEGLFPCNFIKDLDPLDAMEIELEENIRRADLTWQERCEATSQLMDLRRLQAERAAKPAPEPKALAAELYPDHNPSAAQEAVRRELILARQLKDPDVAAAKTMDEAIKVIKRKEEIARNTALGEAVGRTFSRQSHNLLLGNSLELLPTLEANQFDCILTDPPYGMDAQDFGNAGGKASGGHSYDDSIHTWFNLIACLVVEGYRVAKASSHAYMFCDIDNFLPLRNMAEKAGWKCFRTPIVWHNPTSQRAPWPHHGPHRRYQLCLYAMKGDRPVLKLAPDVVTYASDSNLGWAAQKPVALYSDLLVRSCRAGDSVLDPFAGTGTIFPAAHALKIKATGIEMDKTAYGIAVQRLGGL